MDKAEILQVIDSLGLTIDSVFIPYSQSRQMAKGFLSLNWKVTVKRGARDIMEIDFSAGSASCPGNAAKKAPSHFVPHQYRNASGKPYPGTTSAYRYATASETLSQYKKVLCEAECESGVAMELDPFHKRQNVFKAKTVRKADPNCSRTTYPAKIPLVPDLADVMYSVVMDSDVIDYRDFEDWAETFGYGTDSREAEKMYQACLKIALALRVGIGEAGIEKLREAFQDY